jgi:hypothetical protein
MSSITKAGMIFVVGNSRSGTTMLGRMLGRNSEVFSFPELHLFGPHIAHGKEEKVLSETEIINAFCWLLDVSRNGFHHARNLGAYTEEATQIRSKLNIEKFTAWEVYKSYVLYESNRHKKTIPCEDLPGNVFKLEQILSRFNDAKIIHIVRDPRDVVLSQKNRHKRRKMGGHYVSKKEALRVWANYHPFVISKLWNKAVSSALRIKNDRIYTIHFEELLSNPETTLRNICKHLGIEFEIEMLRIPQVGSSNQKDDPNKLGVDAGRTGAWQKGGLSNEEIAICEEVNGALMLDLEYKLTNKKINVVSKVGWGLLLPIKGSLALILNWNRTKGIFNYIIHRFFK